MSKEEGDNRCHPAPVRTKLLELTVSGSTALLCLSGIVGSQMIRVPDQNVTFKPSWWPTILSTVGLGMSLLLLAMTIVGPVSNSRDLVQTTRPGLVKFALTGVLAVLFILAWKYLYSFVVPCAFLLAALLWIYGIRSWKPLLIFPIGTTVGIFVIFQILLDVPL